MGEGVAQQWRCQYQRCVCVLKNDEGIADQGGALSFIPRETIIDQNQQTIK
jgi:hypothetical protein